MIFKQILFVSVPVALLIATIKNKALDKFLIVMLFIALVHYCITQRFSVASEFILFSWMVFASKFRAENTLIISERKVFFIGLTLCLIIGIHYSLFDVKGRYSIGGLGPNYSGFLTFLLFPFARSSRSYLLNALIFFLGFITLSRAFILAGVIYFLSVAAIKIFPKCRLTFKQFLGLVAVSFVLLVGFSYYGYKLKYAGYSHGADRLLNFFNSNSDYERWRANVKFLKFLFSDYNFLFFGIEDSSYIKNYFKYLPHNLVLLEFARRGIILGSAYLILFFVLLKRVYSSEYLPLFLGVLVYWLVLGVETTAIYNVLLIQIVIYFAADRSGRGSANT